MVKKIKLNEDIRSRIHNWKFEAACRYLDTSEVTEEDKEVIKMLSRLIGNSGWFDGDLGILISIAVSSLLERKH